MQNKKTNEVTTKKITSLTQEQKDMLPLYAQKGIKIGLATGSEMNEEEVREITDKHRVICGFDPAKKFKVYDSPFSAARNNNGLSPSNALYGQHDINWLMHYQYFRTECGLIKETEQIVHLMELAKRVGWMWINNNTTIVTRRPKFIHMLETKRNKSGKVCDIKVLHNPNGMALEYADGTGVYNLFGTRITKEYRWLILERGQYDIKRVLQISNAAIKTIGLRLLGPEALVQVGKIIDKWQSVTGGEYTLHEVEINENKRIYLSGECPSKHEPFCYAVLPTITSCREALAWSEEELDLNNYVEPIIRT